MVDKGCSRVYLAVLYSVAEEGEIAEHGIVGEDLPPLVGDLVGCTAIGGAPGGESHRASHIIYVCIEGYDKVSRVYGAPDTEIDDAVAPYHPPQKEP